MKSKQICLSNITQEDNFRMLCDLTTNVMGLPQGSLALKTRKREIQVCRTVASVIARIEDTIHRKVIAGVLNRDRSLIYHYEKNHNSNYAYWSEYRNCFNKVFRAYKDIQKNKKTFLDNDWMKSYLIKNGVKENLKAQVLIEVRSGKAMCIIKTSYFEFSDMLQKIKDAMEGYKFNVKIL
jgi:hypothetical protein